MHWNHLKLPFKALVSYTFVLVYIQEFGNYIYSEHVEATKITVKLVKVKGHIFRNTTYSKAIRFASQCNIINFVGIGNYCIVLCFKAMRGCLIHETPTIL